jgi:hypothetical protein
MQYPNKTKFAAACQTTRTSLNRWLRDPRWPLKRTPPWTDDDVATAKQWRMLLQDDRSAWTRSAQPAALPDAHPHDASIVSAIEATAVFDAETFETLCDEKDLCLPGKLTAADRISLTAAMNLAALVSCQIAALTAGQPLRMKAPDEYYAGLLDQPAGGPADFVHELSIRCWALGRFGTAEKSK